MWKASRVCTGGASGYGLISEAVSPGFEFEDTALGYMARLMDLFPQHAQLVAELGHF